MCKCPKVRESLRRVSYICDGKKGFMTNKIYWLNRAGLRLSSTAKLLLSEMDVHLDDGTHARSVRTRNRTPHDGKPRPGRAGPPTRGASEHQPAEAAVWIRTIDRPVSSMCHVERRLTERTAPSSGRHNLSRPKPRTIVRSASPASPSKKD